MAVANVLKKRKENRAPLHDPRGKFKPNWGEPYVVKEVLPGKAIKLTDLDGNDFGVEELLSMPRVHLQIFASSSS